MPMVHPLSEFPIAAPQKKFIVKVRVLVFYGVLVHEEHIRSLGLSNEKPEMNAVLAPMKPDDPWEVKNPQTHREPTQHDK
jgi:hypothetical protein